MIFLPVVELIRLEENYEFGTFGALRIQKQIYCYTLEPPDLLNAQSISSIPAQQYVCQKYQSPTFGETFIVRDVPGRSSILFHWGNWVRNTEGCILLGSTILKLKNEVQERGVGNSGKTFKDFMRIMKSQNRFHFTVKEYY